MHNPSHALSNSLVGVAVFAVALVLFLGLAFFLNYASEQGWLSVEMRYAGVGLAGIVLQVIGWRLRESKPAAERGARRERRSPYQAG